MTLTSLPETLWYSSQIVMPPKLVDALRTELESRSLFDEACGPNPSDKEIIGGDDTEDAIKHFTHRFKTSAARVQYVVLNPCGTFEPVSSDLLAFLFDGKVSILDIPCGSGGGLLAFLCTVAELRQQGRLPVTPVEVTVLAGDISADARQIHEAMFSRMQPGLAEVGIRILWHHIDWNVTDPFSTSRLVDQWFDCCPNDEEYLIFVSAFSGFADKHLEDVLTAFHAIVARFHSKPCLLFWVEPAMKLSMRVLKSLTDWFTRRFTGSLVDRSSTTTKEFWFRHPFTDERIKSRAQVRSFKRERV